jgi:predicted nuclease of predicted toxin-antitoxin system
MSILSFAMVSGRAQQIISQSYGLEGVKDSGVLAIAAQQGRILVSHDRKTIERRLKH